MRQGFLEWAPTLLLVLTIATAGWYTNYEIYKAKVNIWNIRRLDESIWSYICIIPFINILWWLKDKYLAKRGKNG